MLVQQHSEELARSLHYPVSDSTSVSAAIPNSDDRASKFAAWDAAGEPIVSTGPTGDSSIPVSSFIETLLDDTTAAAARATLAAAALAANTFTGTQTLGSGASIAAADKVIGRAELKDYAETVNAIGSIGGGTQDIDLELGNVVSATVDTSTTTFTFSNPPDSGKGGSFTLRLTNGGSQTVNWPASVNWAGGTAPTLTTSGVDVLTFITLDGGTNWDGFLSGADLQ